MTFNLNNKLADELRAAPEFKEMIGDTAQKLVGFVRDATPKHTGDAQHSVTTIETPDGAIGVGSTDPFWHLIEWGSVHNPPYAPLRNGVRAAGLRFEENSR